MFVSLHNHTCNSILDSIVTPKDLFKQAKELNQSAIAITDHGTLAGAWDSFKSAKEVGIKLIIGSEFYFVHDLNNYQEKFKHIILLAKNAIGYKNILILNRKGFDNTFPTKKQFSIISWELLQEYSEGVICLTACGNGIIAQPLMVKQFDEAEKITKKLQKIFGDDLGLEIQTNNMKRLSTSYNEEID